MKGNDASKCKNISVSTYFKYYLNRGLLKKFVARLRLKEDALGILGGAPTRSVHEQAAARTSAGQVCLVLVAGLGLV